MTMDFSSIATKEINTPSIHLSGDIIQDGPCTGPDHVEMRKNLGSNGGKTPGTPGE